MKAIDNIVGFIISILFWIIILFVNNKYAKIAGVILCVLLFSTRYWDFLVNILKKDQNDGEFDENTPPKT